MQMKTKSVADLCLDLAWSQWASLGVSASGALVPEHAVDLEAAIVFAAALGDIDPRLHDEVLDWCIQYGRLFTSVSVMKHCLGLFDEDHRDRFEGFAAVVNKYGRTKWPTNSPPTRFVPSGKSRLRLDRPAAVQLRARKIFGISARADILVGLVLMPVTPEQRWTHVNLLLELGYTKRNLSEALNDLLLGGTLGSMRFGNTIRYALRSREPLRQLLHPVPTTEGQPWMQRLAVAASLLMVQRRTQNKSMTTQAVELQKLFENRRSLLERSLIQPPVLSPTDPWPAVITWLASELRP